MKNSKQGLVLVNTGNGKGKTTAAFGQAMRMAGHNGRVCIIQFIKGSWKTGEARAVERFGDRMEIHVKGSGFTWEADDLEEVKREGRQAWEFARQKINSRDFDLIVLDELTYLITYGIVTEEEVLAAIHNRPAGLYLTITGRGAGNGLMAAADIVTEMQEIKHHFHDGGKAVKGVDF